MAAGVSFPPDPAQHTVLLIIIPISVREVMSRANCISRLDPPVAGSMFSSEGDQ